jgi:hypothetical protein
MDKEIKLQLDEQKSLIEKLRNEAQKEEQPQGFRDLKYYPILKVDKGDIAIKIIETTTDTNGRDGELAIVNATTRFTFYKGGWQ